MQSPSDRDPRLLFLYASPDSGHKACADALRRAVRLAEPDVETEGVDTVSSVFPVLGKLVSKAYLEIVKRTPQIWSLLYDNPEIEQATRELRQLFNSMNASKFEALRERYRPSAYVCTHAVPCGLIAEQKRKGNCGEPLVAVITDFAVHSYWIDPEVDLYIAPNEACRKTLVERGVPAGRIEVCGIPIDPVFERRAPKAEARENLGLNSDAPVILVMGGARGLGPIGEMAQSLLQIRPQPQILVATGYNKRLQEELAPLQRRKGVRVYGYARSISRLMDASDLLITKPGGVTSSEALAKGLPMLLAQPLPGQETRNANILEKSGAALRVKDAEALKTAVRRLLSRPDSLQKLSEGARKLARPNAAQCASRHILELLRN